MSSVSSLNSLLSSATTSTNSSSVNLSSLLSAATGATSTGIDVNAAVAAAVYAAQAPERQWQTEQATAKSQITALTSIQTALSTLSTDMQSLNDLGGPLTARAVSSSTSAVTATAAAGATLGSHTVSVTSLAGTASWYSPELPSPTSALGTTQLTLVANNGTPASFTTGSGTNSLSSLASAINNSDIGVTASVVNDSGGSRLALVGTASGAANNFSVSFGAITAPAWTSASVASAASTLSAGAFEINDGSQTRGIAVAAGSTLSDVATQINNAGLNITASVVTNSSGAHLALASSNSGSVTVTGDPTLSFTQASQGSDASLKIDGIPITSASNTVTGAVDGLTLNLLGTTPQTTLSVTADSSQIGNGVAQFVSDYNSAVALVNSQFTYTVASSSQGVLSGDATLRTLQSALLGMISYTPASAGASAGASSLASLGITMADDGTLSLDSAKLTQAVTTSPSAVQNFFQGAALNGFAHTFQSALDTYTNAASGALTVGINNLNTTYTALQSQVNDYESGYIASQRTVLNAMYSKAEIALQSLPAQLKQLQAELGNGSSGG